MTVATPSSISLAFVCPRCRGSLQQTTNAYSCGECTASYPIVLGIPDFRVFPDPWIGLEDDRDKARRVDAATRGLGFEAAVRTYWEMTPDTPRDLAERYVRHVVGARARSEQWLEAIRAGAPDSKAPWLELGCGTGDFLAAAASRGLRVVGTDIAMRWLVVARRRPELEDGRIPLVCCCAEALPFPDAAFGRVAALGLLEHCRDPLPVCREARRVLVPDGRADLRTVNRYSLLPEPHVRVWGVGFLPRRYADRFVRWRKGLSYRHHRPVSAAELRRALRRAGFEHVTVGAASPLRQESAALGSVGQAFVPLYAVSRRLPGVRAGARLFAPLLEASAIAIAS